MSSYLFVVIGAVLVNNVVFVRILGLCPFMGVSKKLETAIGMGAATTFVLTLGSGSSYLIDHYLLVPNGLEYLRTLAFIIVIAGIHNNLRKKLHVVFLRRSKLDTDQLHLRLPDLMRGSIGKRMDPDLPGLRIVFNLIQQSRNILVIS